MFVLKTSVEKDFMKGSVLGGLLILYKESHFEMELFEEKRNVFSSLFSEQGKDWHNILRRRGFIAVTLQCKDQGKGKVVTVVNTHPNALPNGVSDIHRTLQFSQIVTWTNLLDNEMGKAMPMEYRATVVCGDFNVYGKTAEMKTLWDAQFADSVIEGKEREKDKCSLLFVFAFFINSIV